MRALLLSLALFGTHSNSFAQWTYDFGSANASFTSSTAGSGSLPTPTSGTARMRVGTNPGSINLVNPGLAALGTNSELQITSNTGSSSTTKFSIHDYTSGNRGYVKFKIAFNGGTNGVYNFSLGNGNTFSDNNAMANSQIFAGMRWSLNASNAIAFSVLNGGSYVTTGISNPSTLFVQSTSTVYTVEVYANNSNSSTSYIRGTSFSLAANTWDIWVDGVRVGNNLAKGGTLANNAAFGSFAFNHQVSATAPGTLYLDDLEYFNALPSNSAPTATVNPISGTLTVGQVLTGSYSYNDADTDAEGTSTFRWFRADNASGLNVAPIDGQTANTYTLTGDDANKYIRFGVTPVAVTGTSPGTETYSAYAGPVTTGNNSVSTITVASGFTAGTNVNYAAFTGTDVTASSYEIARFSVNDIAGTPNDGLATTLTDLTFSLSNSAYIERVALYDDTNTEIQEITASGTLNFSGLNIVAASGASKNFSVRVTFKTVVTDNAQPQLTITSATADVSGSFFVNASAGGASSSVAGDDNKIEVTASALAFLQQPSNSVVSVNMMPAVTVRAIDDNNNTDLDFAGNVSISSTGTLSAPQNELASAGVATFSSINHTVVGTGRTLFATAAGLNAAISNAFNISVQAAGTLITEENFSFSGLLTANGYTASSGTGTNNLSSGTTGLTYPNYGSVNIGNGLAVANNGQDVNKAFTPTQGVDTDTYFAFLVNVSAAQATGDYFFHTGPSPIGSEFRGRVFARLNSGNLQFGVSSTGAATVYAAGNYALNTTYLIVLKHHYSATTVTSSIYINPSVYAEPAVADAMQSTTASTTNIGVVAFRQGNSGSAPTFVIDGVRVATNWGTALGNPQYDATATINGGNYNSVTVLNGTLTANASLTVNNEIHVNNGADFVIPNNTNLIQGGTTNNNSGNVTVHRDTFMKRLDYTYWGSPVAGQDLKLFTPYTVSPTNAPGYTTPTGASRFYTLDEPSNAFVAITEPLGQTFATAKGYMLRAPNTFPTTSTLFNGVFNGVPNNGDIAINVTNTGAGMNMIANPYPSTIDADLLFDNNPSLETFYFWTHAAVGNTSGGANYATYNATGVASPSATIPQSDIPNGTIQIGQGFIAKTNATTAINFTNALRVNNTQGQFFRGVANEKNRIWLNLSKDDSQLNQILTGYVTDATNDLDPKFDAKLVEINGSKLYNVVNNSEYVIQGRALPFSNEDVVALGFKAETAGNYTITLDHVDGLFSNEQDIFIKDNLTNATHNIKEGAFTFASEAGTFNSRFSIVYQNVTLGVENPVDTNSIVVFTKNNSININSGNITMETVKIFDIQGRMLFEQKDINAATTSITNLKATQQVLIVQVTANNTTISKKVVY